jgi:hypothetical protein
MMKKKDLLMLKMNLVTRIWKVEIRRKKKMVKEKKEAN